MLFGSGISSPATWYPAAGGRRDYNGALSGIGDSGCYWSVAPDGSYAFSLSFLYSGYVYPKRSGNRAGGVSVRCLQE